MSEIETKTPYAEMDEHELLVKIAKQGRYRLIILSILLVVVCITAVLVLDSVYKVRAVLPTITETAETVTKMAEQASVSMQKIDSINIETLNAAIEDFSKVAKTIASIFGK